MSPVEGNRNSFRLRCRWRIRTTDELPAYLTVFLSLVLTVLLSFILTVIYGAQVSAARLRAEIVTDIAVNSVLGEYSRALLEQYDLFFADASYGTGSPSVQRVYDHLQSYIERNLTPAGGIYRNLRDFQAMHLETGSISGTRFAVDQDATALKEQIYAYMTADPAGYAAGELLSLLENNSLSSWEENSWNSQWNQNMSEFRGIKDGLDEESQQAVYDAQGDSLSSIEVMNDFRFRPILWQVLGSASDVSKIMTDTSVLASNRQLHYGEGIRLQSGHNYPQANALMMDAYICEKCGNYRDQRHKGTFEYEMEYILFGKNCDEANLEAMAGRLLLVREAINTPYIYTDAEKISAAETVGMTAAILTLSPQIAKPVKHLILLSWAYLESVNDVRALMAGNKVPLVKSGDTWQTSLLDLLTPWIKRTSGSSSGLTYENYLQVFLFLESDRNRTMRLMDIMELNIRQTEGNEHFRMDWCLDTLTVAADFKSRFGGEVSISRTAGYN